MKFIRNLIAAAFLCVCIASPFVLWRELTQETQAGPVGFRLPAKAFINPTSIPGIKLWLDASQITGLSDGGSVTNWLDLSGHTNDLSQPTSSKMPTYQTNEINGLPVVRTDGVDDLIFCTSSIVAAQPLTLFVVARENASSSYLLDGGPSGLDRIALADFTPDGNFGMFAGSSTVTATQTKPIPLTLWRAVINGANSSLFKNSVSFATGNPGSQSLSAGITLGARFDPLGVYFGSYDFCEVIVYDSAISQASIDAVETYLRSKWSTP